MLDGQASSASLLASFLKGRKELACTVVCALTHLQCHLPVFTAHWVSIVNHFIANLDLMVEFYYMSVTHL